MLVRQGGLGEVLAVRLQGEAGVALGLRRLLFRRRHLPLQRFLLGHDIGQMQLGLLQPGDHLFIREIEGLVRIFEPIESLGSSPGGCRRPARKTHDRTSSALLTDSTSCGSGITEHPVRSRSA